MLLREYYEIDERMNFKRNIWDKKFVWLICTRTEKYGFENMIHNIMLFLCFLRVCTYFWQNRIVKICERKVFRNIEIPLIFLFTILEKFCLKKETNSNNIFIYIVLWWCSQIFVVAISFGEKNKKKLNN